jgi:hypothetical protein
MTGGSGEYGKSHREIISQAEMLEKRTFRPSLLPLDLEPIIIPTPNQVKLMRIHYPVTILHVGAVEFVCHILER